MTIKVHRHLSLPDFRLSRLDQRLPPGRPRISPLSTARRPQTGHRRLGGQRLVHRPLHGPKHRRCFAKTHLRLGGMDIHIHQGRVHLHENRRQGKASPRQQGVIRLDDGKSQVSVLNRTIVDK